MKALVSGQSAVAVLIDGESVLSLDHDSGEVRELGRHEVPYLLADATDVRTLSDVTREQAEAALDLACRQDCALHLMLILVDDDSDQESRRLSAESLEDLFGDEAVRDFVSNRLYATPLPPATDLLGDRKSTRLNSSHIQKSRMPSSA